MSRYSRAYGPWDSLEKDEAIERAYALGVAASLGEHDPGELEALREEVESAYDKSVVDLAFEEGKGEAQTIDTGSTDRNETVWSRLITNESVQDDSDETETGEQTGLPEALDRIEALDRPERGSIEAVERIDLLERD
jgi:hypothetical protein